PHPHGVLNRALPPPKGAPPLKPISSERNSSSSADAERCSLTWNRTRPPRYTPSANGHRLRPMTDRSSQRRVAAMISSESITCPSKLERHRPPSLIPATSSILITYCKSRARNDATINSSHPHPRRRDRPRNHRRHRCRSESARRAIRVGHPNRRPRGRQNGRRSPAAQDHREHQTHAPGPEGSPGDPVGRRISLIQRAPEGGIQAVRQSASRAHADSGRPFRQNRSSGRTRKLGG